MAAAPKPVPAAAELPKPLMRSNTEVADTSMFDYWTMSYTVEELRHDWHVVAKDLRAATGYQAVLTASQRSGIYRTAAPVEPDRRYFWRAPDGRLEAMDHAKG
jgi:hypothetical protein